MNDEVAIVVEPRDDGSYDVVRESGERQVVSNHPQRAMAEAERFRLVQAGATDPGWNGSEGDLGVEGPYPDNTGG